MKFSALWVGMAMLATVGFAQTKPETHKYVLLYLYDEGCVPGIAYAEGGCPHQSSMHARWFDKTDDALEYLDHIEILAEHHSALRKWDWNDPDEPSNIREIVGLFEAKHLPLTLAETPDTYDDYVEETKTVVKHKKAYKLPKECQ